MSELFTISSGDLTARIDPLGAELVSLCDASGAEWMTDADPRYWTGHAPILFPIVGELAGGTYRLDGQEYALARHGFARKSMFERVDSSPRSVSFLLTDSEVTREVYPFAFSLELFYEIEDRTLRLTATVTNRGDGDMPFSIGFHPGFAWPLPAGGAKEQHRVVFSDHETGPIRRLDDKGLLRAYEDTPIHNRILRPYPGLFHADAMIWDRLSSRMLRFEGETPESDDEDTGEEPAALELAFPDNDMLGIWQKPGANYLCLEPWSGIADPEGFDGDFREKPGIMSLAAGEARSFRLAITIYPAEAGD